MPYENLTDKPRQAIIWLAEHIKTGKYRHQFWWANTTAPYVCLFENNEGVEIKFSDIDDTDLYELQDGEYITLISQNGNLKGSLSKKAYDEYEAYREETLQSVTSFTELRDSLEEFQVDLITEIWESYYLSTPSKWPLTQAIHGQHDRRRVRSALTPMLALRILREGQSNGKSCYELTILGVLLTRDGKSYESMMVRFLEFMTDEFRKNPNVDRVESEDIDDALGLNKDDSYLLSRLLFLSSDFESGGSSGPKGSSWNLIVPRNIDEYPEIEDMQVFFLDTIMREYFEAQDKLNMDSRVKKKDMPILPGSSNKVFIVHGHNSEVKQATANFLYKLKLEPIILHEQPNKGRTIIEKFEEFSDVAFAIILLTADDQGGPKDESPDNLKKRARQNVILELGYFLGRLGRERVCALYKDGVEIPSDYDGVLFVEYDPNGIWHLELARELRAAGLAVDMNDVV